MCSLCVIWNTQPFNIVKHLKFWFLGVLRSKMGVFVVLYLVSFHLEAASIKLVSFPVFRLIFFIQALHLSLQDSSVML